MRDHTSRRTFLGVGTAAALTGFATVTALAQQQRSAQQPAPSPTSKPDAPVWERPPALNPEDVQAVVGAAHRDVDRVRALLDSQPSLVNATWDWGAGDWESPLGAAGHTGQVEIAELVLSRGGRIELHCAAMLGWLDVIKSAVAARPGVQDILGPHAIPMHSHARAGENQAKEVLEYLESINCVRDVPVEEAMRVRCAGRYRVEGSDDVLTVFNANRRLMLQPPGRRAWFMLHQGDALFRPADGMTVKVTFESDGDAPARAMLIDEGNDQATAVRIG